MNKNFKILGMRKKILKTYHFDKKGLVMNQLFD